MLPDFYYHVSKTKCRKLHLIASKKRGSRNKKLFVNEALPVCCWHGGENKKAFLPPSFLCTCWPWEDPAEVKHPSVKDSRMPGCVCRPGQCGVLRSVVLGLDHLQTPF